MITNQQLFDSCLHEIKVIKHLYGKILPGTLDYRPTEKQRTLLELLQYLGHFVKVEVGAIADNEPITDFAGLIKESHQMSADDFPAAMDKQAELLKKLFADLSDDEWQKPFALFATSQLQPKILWIMTTIYKNLVAYKMQLFLYIKATGNFDIGTSNLTRGEDAK